jgi:hypothetical protein
MKYNLVLQITIVVGIIIFCTNCFAQQTVSNKKNVATKIAVSDSMKTNNAPQQTAVPALSNKKEANLNTATDKKDEQQINNTATKNNPTESNTGVISNKKESGTIEINNKKK